MNTIIYAVNISSSIIFLSSWPSALSTLYLNFLFQMQENSAIYLRPSISTLGYCFNIPKESVVSFLLKMIPHVFIYYCVYATVHVCRSKDNLHTSFFFFLHVGLWDQTQVVSLSGSHLYPKRYFASPSFLL